MSRPAWSEVETQARELVQRLGAAGGLDGGVLTTAGYLAAAIDRIDELVADLETVERIEAELDADASADSAPERVVEPTPETELVTVRPGQRYRFHGTTYGVVRDQDGVISSVTRSADGFVDYHAVSVEGADGLGVRIRVRR